MNRLQQYLSHAGQQFGVQVTAPFTVELDRDVTITVDALLPELGNSLGMLVAESSEAFRGLEARLVTEGYGYTSYYQPFADEDFDPAAYAEMFREWNWMLRIHTVPLSMLRQRRRWCRLALSFRRIRFAARKFILVAAPSAKSHTRTSQTFITFRFEKSE